MENFDISPSCLFKLDSEGNVFKLSNDNGYMAANIQSLQEKYADMPAYDCTKEPIIYMVAPKYVNLCIDFLTACYSLNYLDFVTQKDLDRRYNYD